MTSMAVNDKAVWRLDGCSQLWVAPPLTSMTVNDKAVWGAGWREPVMGGATYDKYDSK